MALSHSDGEAGFQADIRRGSLHLGYFPLPR